MASNICIHCNNCGQINWSKKKGSIFITLILAYFFLIPAIIYEVWRRNGLGICPICHSNAVYPSNGCDIRKKHFQLDIAGILVAVVGIIGAVVLTVMLVIWVYFSVFPTQAIKEQRCFTDGMKYEMEQVSKVKNYNDLMDYVTNSCKNTPDGKYPNIKAP